MYGFRMVVSPTSGRIRLLPPKRFRKGRELVSAGQPIAVVEAGDRHEHVLAPMDGIVDSVLVIEGEPVRRGQPILAVSS